VVEGKDALLLDINSRFIFGEDRFGKNTDYSKYYKSIGGQLPCALVNRLIQRVFGYLNERYPDARYKHCFPSLDAAIDECDRQHLIESDKYKIIETFSYHEHG
jgi:hypothetical protein